MRTLAANYHEGATVTDGHHIDPPTQLRRRQQPNQQLSQASDSEHHSIRTQEKKGRHTRRETNKTQFAK